MIVQTLPQPLPWNALEEPMRCVGVRAETVDVRTFTFRPPPGRWCAYRPGQFVTIELPTAEGPVLRSYTLSSSPSRPFSVSITAKLKAGSVATQWMFDNLAPGFGLKFTQPMGNFHLPDPLVGPLLLISAGSGATPCMSMLRWVADCAPGLKVTYVHAARSADDILFRRELELLAEQMPGLRLLFILGRGAEGESLIAGRLDAQLLRRLVPERLERQVYCCGPQGFMEAMQAALLADGLPTEAWHQESFGPTSGGLLLPEAPEVSEDAVVRFARSGVEVPVGAGQTILQMAQAAGIAASFACGMGVCGTCKVRARGSVEMHHQGGIFEDEVEDGFILACCSRPLASVEVDL
ncbi:NADH oxidase [Haematobacter missouriensis]|nr:hybrid-cluster NAD(P)-dependent oxidoreductase [Haematobacter missouriensis]KFI33029.1 NADH oxidase [Haematobacter missouriensis]